MQTNILNPFVALLTMFLVISCNANIDSQSANETILVDHTCTEITDIPVQYIEAAKKQLAIAYGHTSHGSQITEGMSALIAFANTGGKGMSYPANIFAWNKGGTGDALNLEDYAMGGDVGYYPDWYNNTISYLGTVNSATGKGIKKPEVNVILWSWCGQAAGYSESKMITDYLTPMSKLETAYFNVKFIYMTGHLDGTGAKGNLNLRNEQIRNYCKTNNKILYDFADIESFDPDGKVNYMELFATDNCDYKAATGGSKNWATDWQNSHTKNVDWYDCSAAHSKPLNGNRKAFAAWWLFARLAGWNPNATSAVINHSNENQMKWTVTGKWLKVAWANPKKIEKAELYDLNGSLLYSYNINSMNSEIKIPLTNTNFKKNSIAVFRVIADRKNYSNKFFINSF